MKKLFLSIAGLFMVCNLAAAKNVVTFGTVDLARALKSVKDGKEAKAQLEKDFKAKQEILKAKETQIMKLSKKLQSKMLSAKARATKQQQAQEKLMELEKIRKEYQMAMQQKQIELTKPIIESLSEIVKKIGKEKEYAMVYEKKQSGIIYADEEVDITEDVIGRYNKIHN